jgi:tRNA-2-methylthio-N6-dimethylallyladenosine synthase
MKRKLYLETFGCQMNVLDSELVLGQLHAQGYESVEEPESADVILYNTCSVREHAEQKVWSRLGELRERKAAEPGLVIGVIGCMAERDGENIFRKFPHVDILCGPGELDKLQTLVHNAVLTRTSKDEGGRMKDEQEFSGSSLIPHPSSLDSHPSSFIPHPSIKHIALMGATTRRSSTLAAAEDHLELLDLSRAVSPGDDVSQAYVRITRGCNKFCTYCVVPYTRGAEVHRPPGNIIDEVKMLADAGAKEVTLLGQTINHYAYEDGGGKTTSFADLLYQIHEAVPHLPRLRFVTSFPRDFTDEALQAMRDCQRICRYLHVPAQHGSDRILKMMNRGYTVGEYREFIARARGYMADISIASDFIVGFPTETEQEFATCVALIKECRFKNSFIFKYSPRPGTTAIDRYADDVPEDVKRRRNNELLAAQLEVSTRSNRAMIGQVVEVMVEGESKLVSRKAAYPSAGSQSGGIELGWVKKDSPATQAAPSATQAAPSVTQAAPSATQAAPLATPLATQLVGRTRADQVVVFDGDLSLKGELLDVEITDAKNMTLFARVREPAGIMR